MFLTLLTRPLSELILQGVFLACRLIALYGCDWLSILMENLCISTTVSLADDRHSRQGKTVNGSIPTISNMLPIVDSDGGPQTKYRHIAAVHSKPRTSCLSHDSQTTPSFLGFRNLMIIVLGELAFNDLRVLSLQFYLTSRIVADTREVVMNLRLVVENFMKV